MRKSRAQAVELQKELEQSQENSQERFRVLQAAKDDIEAANAHALEQARKYAEISASVKQLFDGKTETIKDLLALARQECESGTDATDSERAESPRSTAKRGREGEDGSEGTQKRQRKSGRTPVKTARAISAEVNQGHTAFRKSKNANSSHYRGKVVQNSFQGLRKDVRHAPIETTVQAALRSSKRSKHMAHSSMPRS